MGKFMGGLIQTIFGILVLAALAYNYTETQKLRAEVERLRLSQVKQVAKMGVGLGKPITGIKIADSGEKIADPVSTQGHLQKAQLCLKKKDLGCFREEIAAAGKSAEQQGSDGLAALESTRRKVGELQSTLTSLSQQAGKLWETEKKKPEEQK